MRSRLYAVEIRTKRDATRTRYVNAPNASAARAHVNATMRASDSHVSRVFLTRRERRP